VRVADLPGTYPPTSQAVAITPPPQLGEAAEPDPERKRDWEEPGFFERLFGRTSSRGADRPSTLAPGAPSYR
jgi:hypothetical protein